MKAIWKREMRGYFHTPVGYVFLGVFLAISSVLFYLDILSRRSSNLPGFFTEISAIWMLVSPILTMRLLAEERQKKTDQLLLTSPVSLPGIVAGKYLAAVTVLLITAGLTLPYVLIVALYGQVFPAELAVNYLGFILEGCAFAAMDLFLSGCAATPVTAAVLAFGANFMLWILDLLQTAVRNAWVSDILKFVSLYRRNMTFQAGQLSFACIIFDLAFIALFLTLTVYCLDRRRTGTGKPEESVMQRIRRGIRKKKAADRESRKSRVKKWKYSGVSAMLLVMLALSLTALCIGADALEKRNGLRIDLSFNSASTYSEKTQEVLENVGHDVHIWALFRNGDEDVPLLELLDRYAAASSRITWEQADIALNPALVSRFTTDKGTPQDEGLIVWCEDTGRSRLIGPAEYATWLTDTETSEVSAMWNSEVLLTEAIHYVTRERVPQVVIIQGHDEWGAGDLETFENLLKAYQYEVVYANTGDKDFQPDPRDVLVFFSPRQDLSDAELEKLNAFARQGGSFLFTRDYLDDGKMQRMPNYRILLRSCGFECVEGVVFADASADNTYYDVYRNWLLPEMLSTDMTIDLVASGMTEIMMPDATAFEIPEDTDNYMTTSVVLQSGETASLMTSGAAGELTDTGTAGPFALALQSWRITTEGHLSRAFIIGCTEALVNEGILSMTNGQQLTIRVMDYLLDMEASNLSIMPKVGLHPTLGTGSTMLGSVLLVALPAAVLLAALLVLARRRNR